MTSFLEHLIRVFSLRAANTVQDSAVEQLAELVKGFARGDEFIQLYRRFDMGWRSYSVVLPKASEHYNAGNELALGTLPAFAVLRSATELGHDRRVSSQGLIPLGDDATGSGDRFYINLADPCDCNLYCLYDGDNACSDVQDVRAMMHIAFDWSDPTSVVREDRRVDPPGPAS